jgi:thiol:disulfide interchange protein
VLACVHTTAVYIRMNISAQTTQAQSGDKLETNGFEGQDQFANPYQENVHESNLFDTPFTESAANPNPIGATVIGNHRATQPEATAAKPKAQDAALSRQGNTDSSSHQSRKKSSSKKKSKQSNFEL